MEFTRVGNEAMTSITVGAALSFVVPLVIAIIWKVKKKERFTTMLVGAVSFIVFALLLEKMIQNALLFPTQMMLPSHPIAEFFSAHPVLLAFMVGLFPGVFEETGRLIMFKTLLRKRKNRETSISYGIGHGGIEVMLILGLTYVTYLIYAATINSGTFGMIVDQIKAQAPDQLEAILAIPDQIASFTFSALLVNVIERIFAVLFHIGESILVFYACKDKTKFSLYPLAILLHTLVDFAAGLTVLGVVQIPMVIVEGIMVVFGSLTFGLAYVYLYKKDKDIEEQRHMDIEK